MALKLYTVTYGGEVMAGKDREEVLSRVAALLSLDPKDAEGLRQGISLVLLSEADRDEAMTVRNALLREGALAVVTAQEEPRPPDAPAELLDMCWDDACPGAPGAEAAAPSDSGAWRASPEPGGPEAPSPLPSPLPSIDDELKDPDYLAGVLDLAAYGPAQALAAARKLLWRWVHFSFGRKPEAGEPDRMTQAMATGALILAVLATPAAAYAYLVMTGPLFNMSAWRAAACVSVFIPVILCAIRFGLPGLIASGVFGVTSVLILSAGRLGPGMLFLLVAGLFAFVALVALVGAALGASLGFVAWEWAERQDAKKKPPKE